MKRFLLFTSDFYYPRGGWSDFVASYDALDDARGEALLRLRAKKDDFAHVVDTDTEKEVWSAELNGNVPGGIREDDALSSAVSKAVADAWAAKVEEVILHGDPLPQHPNCRCVIP